MHLLPVKYFHLISFVSIVDFYGQSQNTRSSVQAVVLLWYYRQLTWPRLRAEALVSYSSLLVEVLILVHPTHHEFCYNAHIFRILCVVSVTCRLVLNSNYCSLQTLH